MPSTEGPNLFPARGDLPTTVRPLLAGFLVDVSASMVSSSLRFRSGEAPSQPDEPNGETTDGSPGETRLQSVSRALDDFVARGAELTSQGVGANVAPLLKVFMYGFGFGGVLANVLTAIFGGSEQERPKVRDLLALPGRASSTVGIDELARDWAAYRQNVEAMLPDMLGQSPMASAFRTAHERFHKELQAGQYAAGPILFVVSDGEPTSEDWATDPVAAVREIASAMKAEGITIISCLLTGEDVVEPRRVHGSPGSKWPPGAKLLFECASDLPPDSPFEHLFEEYGWEMDPGARLFAQVNHTDVLTEFSKLVLSRLPHAPTQAQSEVLAEVSPGIAATDAEPRHLRIFVSYSHHDERYLQRGGLLDYLSGLQQQGIEFWWDEGIETGTAWDARIRDEIKKADATLVLVSQPFLNSRYCQDVEVHEFLEARKRAGLRIFPVILSPCDWKSFDWLRETQVQPRSGTIETDFATRGKRAQLYLEILNELRALARPSGGEA